jgi:branched-chain amino acid transport system substrate-binding protein
MQKKLLFATLAAVALMGAGCAKQSTVPTDKSKDVATPAAGEPILIGVVGPLSGDAAVYGEPAKNITEMAIEEINAAGGINGRPLKGIYEDGKCNPKDGATAGQKLISQDKVCLLYTSPSPRDH